MDKIGCASWPPITFKRVLKINTCVPSGCVLSPFVFPASRRQRRSFSLFPFWNEFLVHGFLPIDMERLIETASTCAPFFSVFAITVQFNFLKWVHFIAALIDFFCLWVPSVNAPVLGLGLKMILRFSPMLPTRIHQLLGISLRQSMSTSHFKLMSGIPYALTIHPQLLVVKLVDDDVRRLKAHLEGCDNLQMIRRVHTHTRWTSYHCNRHQLARMCQGISESTSSLSSLLSLRSQTRLMAVPSSLLVETLCPNAVGSCFSIP